MNITLPLPSMGSELQMVGMWELVPCESRLQDIYTFFEDGTLAWQSEGRSTKAGYFSFDGANLTMADRSSLISAIANVSENTLTMRFPEDNTDWIYQKITQVQ